MSSLKSIQHHATAEYNEFFRRLLDQAYYGISEVQPQVLLTVSWFFGGPDIAEKLRIPYIQLQPFPSTPTRDFPHFAIEDKVSFRANGISLLLFMFLRMVH